MKITKIGYLIKEGIRGIFLHGFMSFAAICVTVACLLIVGSVSCLTYNFSIMVEDLNKTNEILVFVDENLSDAEARSVGTLINKVPNVHQSTFISREEVLEKFKNEYGESASVALEADTFRHRYSVILQDNGLIEETAAKLDRVEGVVKVDAAYKLADWFDTLQNVLRVVSVVAIGILLLVSLLIISNTIKLAMYDRKDEISIMKMVGATNGFIRLPYVVEGFTLGMVGAGAAFALEWFLYNLLMDRLAALESFDVITFVPFQELLVPMVTTFTAAGLFVGIVGSWTSIRKFMDV